MKKSAYLIILLLVVSLFLNAQKNRVFISSGYSILSEYGRTPVAENIGKAYNYNIGKWVDAQIYSRWDYYSLITKSYNIRFNILEFNPNHAVGLNFYPALGITLYKIKMSLFDTGINSQGIGKLELPLYLSYEHGLGATYKTDSRFGAFVGVGMQFTKSPMFEFKDPVFKQVSNIKEPIIVFGFRFWSKFSVLQEINFKISIGPKTQMPVESLIIPLNYEVDMIDSKAYAFKLTWMRYLRY